MRVGDIIRIHRANIGTYKNYKTFSVNLAFGSSWVIFSGFEDSLPPKCSVLEPRKMIGEESKISPIKDYYNNPGQKTICSEAEDGVPARKVTPYKSSSKEFSLSVVDLDIVTRYRAWLADYFQNEFNYEATLFMNLSKVREFIFNEGLTGKGPAHLPQFNYPREYDLVVRVDEISTLDPNLAAKVMTGGHQPMGYMKQ
mmetsp:Transcript_39538/g.51782  ORF Transcript_39538/g.51782 Transcript_39538/m.51782 type:complete len:198 (+) Transcript_39538:479-1072(+)